MEKFFSWIESSTEISFPGLKIDGIDIPRGFTIGPFTIYFYALILGLGLVLACIYGIRRRKAFGLTEDDILDGLFWIVPFAFVCARLYYCIFYWSDGGYGKNPLKILYVWEGGLAIYGGVIGAAIGIWFYCRRKKLPIATALDITAVSFLIGQAIGRWGNFVNREAFGAETTSFLRMGLFLTEDGDPTFKEHFYHPTFLYESLWNAAGFVLLHFMSKRRKYDGQLALGYVAWYGLGRTFMEGLREDSLYLFKSYLGETYRVSQLLAAISCFAAVAMLVYMSFKEHDPAKLYVNRVAAEAADETAMESEEKPEEEPEEKPEEKDAEE